MAIMNTEQLIIDLRAANNFAQNEGEHVIEDIGPSNKDYAFLNITSMKNRGDIEEAIMNANFTSFKMILENTSKFGFKLIPTLHNAKGLRRTRMISSFIKYLRDRRYDVSMILG